MRNYNSKKLQHEIKKQFVLDRLLEKGVIRSQDGLSVYDMDYEELKFELVLSIFREKAIENDNNRWF